LLGYLSGPAKFRHRCEQCEDERNDKRFIDGRKLFTPLGLLVYGNAPWFSRYKKIEKGSYYCRTNNGWGSGGRRPTFHLDCLFKHCKRNNDVITSVLDQVKEIWKGDDWLNQNNMPEEIKIFISKAHILDMHYKRQSEININYHPGRYHN